MAMVKDQTTHSSVRHVIETGIDFDTFRAGFDQAVPEFDKAVALKLVQDGGTWDDMRAYLDENAPFEFMNYGTLDVTPLMGLAGHSGKSVEYLVGNHAIAEQMYAITRNILLYVPLRVALYSDAEGNAVFAIDQPSTVFAGLNNDDITDVGVQLDRKVERILGSLGVDFKF